MPQSKRVFVTGATGFVGSHLAFHFLEQGHHVSVLARSSKSASARERVEETLRAVAASNDAAGTLFERLDVLEGDISRPGLDLNAAATQQLTNSTDEVWHCAASLNFAEEHRDEIFRMNVGGTEHILQLVAQMPSKRLHHVSTAYVAGNRTDVAMESDIDVGQSFKNAYEESKNRSEVIISEAHRKGAVRASVYRPSVVIGDSRSGRTTHFHGVYAFIRGLWAALERLRRKLPEGSTVHLPLRVVGSLKTTLNLVPIDYVVQAMAAIGASDASLGRTYHLTNPVPTPNSLWLENICRMLRVEGVELVDARSFSEQPPTKLEVLFQKQMAFYYLYLHGEPRFDNRNAAEALKGTGITCPVITAEFIENMMVWYLDYLKRT
jgi:thioester reductase-like protein